MDVPVFYTHFIRPPEDFEKEDDTEMVERAGYVPADVMINQMIMAGMRLEQGRRESYDYGEDEEVGEEIFVDPTRAPGVDFQDVANAGIAASASIEKARKEVVIERKKKADEDKAAFDAWKAGQEAAKEAVNKDG